MNNLSKSGFYFLIASVIFVLSGYLTNIWLGRYLGPTLYGIYGIVISIVSLFSITQNTGIPQSISKFISENEKKTENVFKAAIILQLYSTGVISLAFFVFAHLIAIALKDQDLTIYLRLASLVIFINSFYYVYLAYYNGLHLFKKQAVLEISYSLAKLFFVVGISYFYLLHGAIVGFIIAPLVAILIGFKLPLFKVSAFPYKKIIRFSLPIIGVAMVSTLAFSVDLYLVKFLLNSNKEVGFYTANQNISRIPFYALNALGGILFPSISRYVSKGDIPNAQNIIRNSFRAILLILIPGSLMISATSSPLLEFLYSSEYIPAANSLSILIIGVSFFTAFALQSSIINGLGKPNISLGISLISVIVTSALCLLLIKPLHLNGAAISTTVGSIIALGLSSSYIYWKFKVLISFKSILKIIFASLVLYFLAKVIYYPPVFLPFIYIILSLTYILILIILRELTKSDWEIIRGLMPRRTRITK